MKRCKQIHVVGGVEMPCNTATRDTICWSCKQRGLAQERKYKLVEGIIAGRREIGDYKYISKIYERLQRIWK